MSGPEEQQIELEESNAHESDYYGILTGIVGLLIGFALIVFMFAVADGFS